MLQTVVFLILRSLLGHFIDLSRSHLNLSIWSGSFTFTDLFIRPALLSSLGLPVTLFDGRVNKLHITVPWRSLWAEKVKITVEGCNILGESNAFTAQSKARRRATKSSMSTAEEQERRKSRDSSDDADPASNQKPTAGYLTKLLSTILHNVEVEITELTIQYLTPGVSKPPHKPIPCSVTLQIESVKLLTTGETWSSVRSDFEERK